MVVAAVAESAAYSQLKTMSSAVNGLPSCQTTFFFSFQVTDLPSLPTAPFWIEGISAARIGTRLPSGSNAASGSEKVRHPSRSLVPGPECGMRRVGGCHHHILRGHPSPRLVGAAPASA